MANNNNNGGEKQAKQTTTEKNDDLELNEESGLPCSAGIPTPQRDNSSQVNSNTKNKPKQLIINKKDFTAAVSVTAAEGKATERREKSID